MTLQIIRTRKNRTTMKTIHTRMSDEAHARMKTNAYKEGSTIQMYVLDAIESWCDISDEEGAPVKESPKTEKKMIPEDPALAQAIAAFGAGVEVVPDKPHYIFPKVYEPTGTHCKHGMTYKMCNQGCRRDSVPF